MASSSSTALAQFNASSSDPDIITTRLQEAKEKYHLVSPAASVGEIPDGFAISLSTVLIDVERESYVNKKTGLLALTKTALDRMSSALGLSWHPLYSRRTDSGSDFLLCRWCAFGTYRSFDGTVHTISRSRTIDLRPGSSQLAGKTPDQIAQEKNFIVENAETKAINRCIRAVGGLRAGYTEADLRKPFVAARLTIGHSRDPALQRELTLMRAAAMINGARALYGEPPAMDAALEALALPPAIAPPPVGQLGAGEDEDEDDEDDRPAPTPGVHVCRYGKSTSGCSIDQISDEDLAWYTGLVEKSINDPKRASYKAGNQQVLDECLAEQAARAKEDQAAQQELPKAAAGGKKA